LWAAFTALVNQQSVAIGGPSNTVGFINPAVYAIGKSNANYTSMFHDIANGNNFSGSSPTNFPAVAGYDLCTGWGTPAGTNLINALAPHATVIGRWVFYNNSAWDGNNPAANTNDDNAIATDKTALLPGGTATFANYTSYSRGLNGIMVDIANLPDTPTASDFVFKTGNDNNPAGWSNVPAPVSITVRASAGTRGSDRVTLIWNDNNLNGVADANEAVAGQWLEVTIKATTNTGLPSADRFYFGNAPGESGNSATDAEVSILDAFAVVNHVQLAPPVAIDNQWDFDRNRLVSIVDAFIPVNHIARSDAALQLIDLSGGGSLPAIAASPTILQLNRSALGLSLEEETALNDGLPPTGTGDQCMTIRVISVERLATGETRLLIYAAGAPANFQIQQTDNPNGAAWHSVPEQNIQWLGERLLELTFPSRGANFFRLAVSSSELTNVQN
jgi:hypothetical protein